jgi:hypothetical protein
VATKDEDEELAIAGLSFGLGNIRIQSSIFFSSFIRYEIPIPVIDVTDACNWQVYSLKGWHKGFISLKLY